METPTMEMNRSEQLHEKVLRFIDRFTGNGTRQEVIDTFSCGCCYWFAEILHTRFFNEAEECSILYDPIVNHWACQIDGIIYDITGYIPPEVRDNWEFWHDYEEIDALHTARLYRDCINFEEEDDI